jgi:CspA family cold shock protein
LDTTCRSRVKKNGLGRKGYTPFDGGSGLPDGRRCAAHPNLEGAADVAIGTVKWFNPTKGYGFKRHRRQGRLRPHLRAVERAGLSTLNEGARVSYEEMENRGKVSAEGIKVG